MTANPATTRLLARCVRLPWYEVVDRAVAHGDEHVIKLTDTAADAYAHSGRLEAGPLARGGGPRPGRGHMGACWQRGEPA